MIAFVKKANNAYNAVPQRDSFNKAMNDVMKDDGSFDLDYMLRHYKNDFFILVNLVSYQVTKNSFFISPTEVYVRATKKYEPLFEQLEVPLFQAIKRAIFSEERLPALAYSKTKSFFLSRAVLADLPDRLKGKALSAAKIAHGDDYDTTDLETNTANLNTILTTGVHGLFFFDLNKFEFEKIKYL